MSKKSISIATALLFFTFNVSPLWAQTAVILTDYELDQVHAAGLNFSTFNNFLGKLYAHNLLTLNADWFEEEYLKLDGYASAIYRRFFSTRRKVEELELRDLVEFFGFVNNCRYPAIIKQAFEDIKNAGLINDYKIIVNGGKFSKGVIEVVKSSK